MPRPPLQLRPVRRASALAAALALTLPLAARGAEPPQPLALLAAGARPDSALAARAERDEAAQARWQVGLLRADRLQHGSLSFTLAAGAALASRHGGGAFALTVGIGIAKECDDARRTRFDPVDLAADAIGAALGAWAGSGGRR